MFVLTHNRGPPFILSLERDSDGVSRGFQGMFLPAAGSIRVSLSLAFRHKQIA